MDAESETGHGLSELRRPFCSQPAASDLKLSIRITFGPSSHKLQACTISGVPIRCTKCSYRLLQGGHPGDEVGSRTLNAVHDHAVVRDGKLHIPMSVSLSPGGRVLDLHFQ